MWNVRPIYWQRPVRVGQAAKAGSHPPVKARRRQNAIDKRESKSVAELLPATGEVGTAKTDRAGTRFPPAQRGFGGISLHKLCGLFVFLGDLQNALRSAISGQQKQNS